MHRSELERVESCAACGRAVSEGVGRGYDFGSSQVLCWDCAVERGGSWDESRDCWAQPPRIEDLRVED